MITKVEHRGQEGEHLCVLGAVDSEKGREIACRMMAYLIPHYDLYIIWHDGSHFEQPALRYAQELSRNTGEAVLYLHTRGAFNTHKTTEPTHRMWEHEFGKEGEKYFRMVHTDQPTVACPFTGEKKITWYNGFVANASAMTTLPDIEPSSDRQIYERLFCNTDITVLGKLAVGEDGQKENSVITARAYLHNHYLV